MQTEYSIGQLSKLTDCKIPTIRYYEDIQLLPTVLRTSGNQRRYTKKHLMILKFIRHARQLGFDLNAIKQLKHLSECDAHELHAADDIAQHHLYEIEQRINKLQLLQTELKTMLQHCQRGDVHRCSVLDVLANHELCEDEH